jgi:hypothetical protein
VVARRYYLLKRHAAAARRDDGLAAAWHAKQELEPGTALPADLPALSRLNAAGYTAREDLDGATTDELQRHGLSHREASAVIKALTAS